MKPLGRSEGNCRRTARVALAFVALLQSFFGPLLQAANADDDDHHHTKTPIKHVIVIHLFATYQPKSGETVSNLLSKGIINADGSPGPRHYLGWQYSADVSGSNSFELSPTTGKALFESLPAPLNGGPSNVCVDNGICTYKQARSSENALSSKTTINSC